VPRTVPNAANTSRATRQATYTTAQKAASTQKRFLASYEPPTVIPGDALTPTQWPFPLPVRPNHRSRRHDQGEGGHFSPNKICQHSSRVDPPLSPEFCRGCSGAVVCNGFDRSRRRSRQIVHEPGQPRSRTRSRGEGGRDVQSRECACGCGQVFEGPRQKRYIDDAHRQRAGRRGRPQWRRRSARRQPEVVEVASDGVEAGAAQPDPFVDDAVGWEQWSARDRPPDQRDLSTSSTTGKNGR
jgi:hypothetical protein